MKNDAIKKMTTMAMFSALAYVLCFIAHLLGLTIVPGVPFLTYDPKDIIIVISGLVLGPWYAVGVSFVTSFIEMLTFSSTGFYGLIMNVIATCAFALPTALIYKYKKSLIGAIISLCVGFVCEIAVMTLWNIIITPIYMGVARDVLISNYLGMIVLFNVVQTGVNVAMVLVLYKSVVISLRKLRLVKESTSEKRNIKSFLIMLSMGGFILLTFILLWLGLRNII